MTTFLTTPEAKEIRNIDIRLAELRVLMGSNPSNKFYRDEFNRLSRKKQELRKVHIINSQQIRSASNKFDNVQRSVEFARANGVREDRIVHSNNELRAWLAGKG